jgi:hypothetical protein
MQVEFLLIGYDIRHAHPVMPMISHGRNIVVIWRLWAFIAKLMTIKFIVQSAAYVTVGFEKILLCLIEILSGKIKEGRNAKTIPKLQSLT